MISQEPPRKRQKSAAVLACVSSYFLQMQCLIILVSLSDCIAMLRSEKKSDASQKRTWKQRMKWSEFQGRLTDRQFRRMFRMSRECFLSLCQKIESNRGAEDFKSEAFLDVLESEGRTTMRGRIYDIHKKYCGGLICGEIKLAITIRLMTGGSYLDLAALYVCGFSYTYQIFHYVNANWICSDDLTRMIDFYDNLTDEDAMKKGSMAFANGSSMGILYGCIGAIDGWLVKICCPSLTRDLVQNAG